MVEIRFHRWIQRWLEHVVMMWVHRWGQRWMEHPVVDILVVDLLDGNWMNLGVRVHVFGGVLVFAFFFFFVFVDAYFFWNTGILVGINRIVRPSFFVSCGGFCWFRFVDFFGWFGTGTPRTIDFGCFCWSIGVVEFLGCFSFWFSSRTFVATFITFFGTFIALNSGFFFFFVFNSLLTCFFLLSYFIVLFLFLSSCQLAFSWSAHRRPQTKSKKKKSKKPAEKYPNGTKCERERERVLEQCSKNEPKTLVVQNFRTKTKTKRNETKRNPSDDTQSQAQNNGRKPKKCQTQKSSGQVLSHRPRKSKGTKPQNAAKVSKEKSVERVKIAEKGSKARGSE